jgi:GAF domain-containing protein
MHLYLIDQDQVFPPVTLPLDQVALSAVIETGIPTIVDDLSSSDRPDYQLSAGHTPPDEWETGPAMHTALIVPLLVGGRTIGTYNLTRRQSNAFTALDQSIVTQIAAPFAIALENARLFTQAAERVQTEQLRSQIGTGLNTGDLTTLVLETTQGIGRALNARRARIRFVPPSEESAG